MMRILKGFALAAVVLMALSVPLLAQTNVTPNLGTTVPSSWYTDRYAPAGFGLTNGFQGRNNVLGVLINSTTNSSARPGGQQGTFYNTQGMKYDVNTSGSWSYSLDLFVENSWANAQNGYVRTDIWATATNDPGFVTPTAYPIVGFTNYGGFTGFRGYDGSTGLWMNFLSSVSYGGWNTLTMSFDDASNVFSYFVNGTFQSSFMASGSGVANVMVQGYNFNDPALGVSGNPDYGVHWSNAPPVSAVPEPASMVLLATGLIGMAIAQFRRKKKDSAQTSDI